MTIEKLDSENSCNGDKINELIDAVNALSKKLDYIELWIENHEANILPRFQEEILKCLEDAEFRNSFFNTLFPESARKGFIPYEHIDANKTIDKLKEAEEELDKILVYTLDLVGKYSNMELFNRMSRMGFHFYQLNEAYKNWKEARGNR